MKTYTKDDIRYFTIPAFRDNSYDIICFDDPNECLYRIVTGSPSSNDQANMDENIEAGTYDEVDREDILRVISEEDLEEHIEKYLEEINGYKNNTRNNLQ